MADKPTKWTRRSMLLGSSAALAGGMGLPATAAAHDKPKVKTYKSADFYDADGNFVEETARQAYYDMFKRFGFPNPKPQQEIMWVQDFGMGDFAGCGMAGIFWHNDMENNFFGHDIYLLPGQMLPEHKHVKTDKAVAKMEAWHVRHGEIHCFGEGDETKPCPVKLPKSQEACRTVKHAHRVQPGEVYALNRPEAFHFMIAGPEGAIVSEYATAHDNDGLRFANPKVKF